MTNPRKTVSGLDIVADEVVGEGGFLSVRRMSLRNRRDNGTVSAPYPCEFTVRSMGPDAVVVALFSRQEPRPDSKQVRVLIRRGLRPAMTFGRDRAPIPDNRSYLFFAELVAGILEHDDIGVAGLRKRAVLEVWEEAGYRVAPADIILLGAGTFPTPGAMAEKFWLTAVEIPDIDAQHPLEGDGSPMEESAVTEWLDLNETIALCVAGEIEDTKTELTLRRLQAWLGGTMVVKSS